MFDFVSGGNLIPPRVTNRKRRERPDRLLLGLEKFDENGCSLNTDHIDFCCLYWLNEQREPSLSRPTVFEAYREDAFGGWSPLWLIEIGGIEWCSLRQLTDLALRLVEDCDRELIYGEYGPARLWITRKQLEDWKARNTK